jgi:hypothetical protein
VAHSLADKQVLLSLTVRFQFPWNDYRVLTSIEPNTRTNGGFWSWDQRLITGEFCSVDYFICRLYAHRQYFYSSLLLQKLLAPSTTRFEKHVSYETYRRKRHCLPSSWSTPYHSWPEQLTLNSRRSTRQQYPSAELCFYRTMDLFNGCALRRWTRYDQFYNVSFSWSETNLYFISIWKSNPNHSHSWMIFPFIVSPSPLWVFLGVSCESHYQESWCVSLSFVILTQDTTLPLRPWS